MAENKTTKNEWVFIPVRKDTILKRTETYVLFKVSERATAIISSKFVRKKENEDFIFVSLPQDYKVNWRMTQYNQTTRKYYDVAKGVWLPSELKENVNAYYKTLESDGFVSEEDTPF